MRKVLSPTVILCKLSDTDIDSTALSFLPRERQGRIANSLRRQKAVQMYVSSMLCDCVLRQYGSSLSAVKQGAHGKPYVEGELYFNLSHSGEYVVMAVGDRPVGIDVEKKKDLSPAVAKSFLNPEELDYVSARPELPLTSLWCRKEAFLKCLGYGWDKANANRTSVLEERILFEQECYSFGEYEIDENYFLTVCEKREAHSEFSIEEVSKSELERCFCESYRNDPRK